MTLTRVAPWCALAAVALLGYLGWTAHLRSDAVLGERIRARETVIAALAARSGATDTAYVHDTVTRTRTRLVTDSILRTDTLLAVDTVRQIVQGERLACDLVTATCERRVAVRDSIIAQKDSLLADVKRRHGPRFLGLPLGCTAGLAATPSGSGIGAACGVRIF